MVAISPVKKLPWKLLVYQHLIVQYIYFHKNEKSYISQLNEIQSQLTKFIPRLANMTTPKRQLLQENQK